MNNNGNPNDEPDSFPESRDLVTLLSDIYLEAGLPLDFAVRSAIADYELFDSEIVCAS